MRSGSETNRRGFLGCAGAALAAIGCKTQPASRTKFTISYPTRSGAAWPIWIAARGGYFAKYGLDTNLVFGIHPAGVASLVSGQAQMILSGMEQIIAAAVRDPQMAILGSTLNRGSMALLARPEIKSGAQLKGKRIGIGRLGDPVYFYTLDLLHKFGLTKDDVEWVATAMESNVRASQLVSGAVDAVLLTPPSYFKLEAQGLTLLATLTDFSDIFISVAIVCKKDYLAANPQTVEAALKAQGEAVKRFYADKPFAVETYRFFDPQSDANDIARLYDTYAAHSVLERVPMLRAAAVTAAADRLVDQVPNIRSFDFKQVVDNSVVVRLIKEGWFEQTFGPSVSEEQALRLKEAA
jgi:ABC-type nitrate/sulfonate/bicarbonate transport system substrate-binding protein